MADLLNQFFRTPILLITATLLFSSGFINAQNVGIGTATPQLGKLEVKGSTGAVSAIFYDQSTGVAIENNHPGIGFNSYYNNGRKSIAPGFGGLMGMDPVSGKFHIYTAPSTIATAGSSMLLTERMSILANGNVGIGVASPTAKLDVDGNLKIADGTQGEGKILTSDALGNASWQSGASLVPGASIGYGAWGDCATNGNIGAYQPLTGAAGTNNFGKSVSLSGNYAIVGAPFETIGSNFSQGTATIFRHDGNGWVLMQKLTDATGAAYEHFGSAVAISGQFAIIGAPRDQVGANVNQGSVSIFRLVANNWVLMQKITDATGTAENRLGHSVSIDGTVAMAGAPDENGGYGSATIYRYNGSTWLPQKITQTSPVNQGFFGSSVAISGNRAIVGVPNGVVVPSQSGLAVIYDYNGSTWLLKQTLFDAARDNGDNFGCSVSISGNNAIVGARLDDNPLGNEGSATIYEYDGSVWATIQKLKLTGPNLINASLGNSVSISGNYALAGAFTDDVNSVTDQGSATLFVKIGSFWQRVQLITDPQGMQTDRLGSAVALDAGTGRFITASDNFNNGQGKVTFGKIN